MSLSGGCCHAAACVMHLSQRCVWCLSVAMHCGINPLTDTLTMPQSQSTARAVVSLRLTHCAYVCMYASSYYRQRCVLRFKTFEGRLSRCHTLILSVLRCGFCPSLCACQDLICKCVWTAVCIAGTTRGSRAAACLCCSSEVL